MIFRTFSEDPLEIRIPRDPNAPAPPFQEQKVMDLNDSSE